MPDNGAFDVTCGAAAAALRPHSTRQVRDEYDYWVYIQYYNDEASRLGQFMCAAIYHRILRDVVDNLPDMGRETAESTIVSIMQGMVKGAATGAYNGARSAAVKLLPILQEKMKPLIEPCVAALCKFASFPSVHPFAPPQICYARKHTQSQNC